MGEVKLLESERSNKTESCFGCHMAVLFDRVVGGLSFSRRQDTKKYSLCGAKATKEQSVAEE